MELIKQVPAGCTATETGASDEWPTMVQCVMRGAFRLYFLHEPQYIDDTLGPLQHVGTPLTQSIIMILFWLTGQPRKAYLWSSTPHIR